MKTLELYKQRRHTTIDLKHRITGEVITFKIPNEYTVEEVERLYELQVKRQELEKQPAGDTPEEKAKQMQDFYGFAFDQLEIMFQHFHPEVTALELRNLISHNEALEMIGWFQEHRQIKASLESDDADVKKKVN